MRYNSADHKALTSPADVGFLNNSTVDSLILKTLSLLKSVGSFDRDPGSVRAVYNQPADYLWN